MGVNVANPVASRDHPTMSKGWVIAPVWEQVEAAARRWNLPPIIAQVLHNRGIGLEDRIADFLDPQLTQLLPPEALPGVVQAARILADAVATKEPIVIYGDYDVDGIAAVAILWHLLTVAGANVNFYIPHRLEEGYGLNVEAIRTLANEGAKVIVSVDCGVTAMEAAREAKLLGAKLIITDHHQVGPKLPEAEIIVHPTVGGTYANPHICGAGVAFKLAWALAKELSRSEKVKPEFRDLLSEFLSLVALATIADVVQLSPENRIFTVHGLNRLPQTKMVGLKALLGESNGNGSAKAVSSHDVGFRLAPRLNAAGRLGHARLAVEMLTRADANRAREIALYLDEQNRKRQGMERQLAQQASQLVEKHGMDKDSCRGIVLAAEGWHAGVIGIVASRMVDKYHRPTVMISLDREIGQGSARSVEHFHLYDALSACGQHLVGFGGHAMAAGLKIQPEKIGLFTEAFIAEANNRLTAQNLQKTLRLDGVACFGDLDIRSVEALERLGPFGIGNPRPRFATDTLELFSEPRTCGNGGSHVQATFRQGEHIMRSIGFGLAEQMPKLQEHRRCRVAFEPMINEYNGRKSVELRIVDYDFGEL